MNESDASELEARVQPLNDREEKIVEVLESGSSPLDLFELRFSYPSENIPDETVEVPLFRVPATLQDLRRTGVYQTWEGSDGEYFEHVPKVPSMEPQKTDEGFTVPYEVPTVSGHGLEARYDLDTGLLKIKEIPREHSGRYDEN